ncbi:hypothetical protein PybrP1_009702 [[Pythium] brassicae (nom. inval.)]|nr:hypothetical protein PybrP1_009702 [[Pythium] brassicae (nom. inval.)]
MVLWELTTGEVPFADMQSMGDPRVRAFGLPADGEARVVQSISQWDELITRFWSHNSSRRPSAAKIVTPRKSVSKSDAKVKKEIDDCRLINRTPSFLFHAHTLPHCRLLVNLTCPRTCSSSRTQNANDSLWICSPGTPNSSSHALTAAMNALGPQMYATRERSSNTLAMSDFCIRRYWTERFCGDTTRCSRSPCLSLADASGMESNTATLDTNECPPNSAITILVSSPRPPNSTATSTREVSWCGCSSRFSR